LADLFKRSLGNCLSTTSCSGPTIRRGSRPARRSRRLQWCCYHLENHDVAFSAVSRALSRSCKRTSSDWAGLPVDSSFKSDFNNDFSVSFTERSSATGARIQLPARASPSGAGQEGGGAEAEPRSGPCAEPTCPRSIAIGPGRARSCLKTRHLPHLSTYAREWTPFGQYQWLDRP